MSRQADVYSIPSMRVILAPGAIAKLGPFSGQLSAVVKLLAGGTLEIGAINSATAFNASGMTFLAQAAGSTFLTGQTFGMLYQMSSNEAFSVNLSGEVYLYASGATCVVGIASGKSAS